MALPYIIARRPLRFTRPLTLPLLLLNFSLGMLVFVQGCLSFATGDVRHVILGVVCLICGLLVAGMEFVHLAAIRMHASFLFSFAGRGLFYLVFGCLTIDDSKATLGIGLVLVIAAVGFIGVALVPALAFDDPQDEYAAMVYNLQHGYFGSSAQKSDPHMLSTAKKTKRSGGAYSGHGISSSDTFNLSGASYLPQSTADYSSSLATSGPGTTTKPPRI